MHHPAHHCAAHARRRARSGGALVAVLAALALAGCGGGGGGNDAASTAPPIDAAPPTDTPAAVTTLDAVRLAQQASFGANEALVAQVKAQGAAAWIKAQMAAPRSAYTSGQGDAIHKYTASGDFCADKGNNCWRDWYSTQPLLWDFYRNAVRNPDQLRQRMAFALQQIVVVSSVEVSGTYGFRNYHNALLDNALGNYRQVLKKVALSPVMGDFLNNANNSKDAPNENFARELMQLFAIGTCQLGADGQRAGGVCTATYDNEVVRAYAYALTGWTYPPGGATSYGCYPTGANCRYYGGDMVAVARYHDTTARTLLSGVTVPANSTAPQALELVLDSLMQHPNMAPFISRQLIQHLVTANPSPDYVQRVAAAFRSGSYTAGGVAFGAGQAGDLSATAAAILLDPEARSETPARASGQVREPALLFTGTLRALNGQTDGDPLSYWWGESLRQHVFRSPSVFNFYPPDYPMPGTDLYAPGFAIHNANTALERLNFLTYALFWDGTAASADVPNAVATKVNLTAFETDAADAAKLVDRLSLLATGSPLPDAARSEVIAAVTTFDSSYGSAWKTERVKQAAYLVFASPQFQVQQ